LSSADDVVTQRDGAPVWWRIGEVTRFGCYEFMAVNPPGIVAGTVLPRMVLQTLFFTLLGSVVAGPEQRRYAFVGGLVMALSMTNVLYVTQVPVADKEFATFWRARTGRLHPIVVFLARALPYPVAGFVVVVVSAIIAAPLTGLTGLAVSLAPLCGIYLLISFTSTAAGLAAGALSVGRHAEVLYSNLMAYVIMLCSGVFLPPGRVAVIDAIGQVLPARHGVAGTPAALQGRPFLAQVIGEAATGAGWLAAMALIVVVQMRRAERQGHDDFE
jgi:ABC-type multidrug transport system permease subunit